MLKNVVPANKIRPPKKQRESLERSIVKLPAIVPAAPDVEDFFAVAAGFRIEKGYGGHTGSIAFLTKLQRCVEFRFIPGEKLGEVREMAFIEYLRFQNASAFRVKRVAGLEYMEEFDGPLVRL